MLRSIMNGLIGAVTLTVAHQVLRNQVADAPKMDKLGEEGVENLFEKLGRPAPTGKSLTYLALAGDIALNTLYYSQVGSSRGVGAVAKGLSLGLGAGLGTAKLPSFLGFSKDATEQTPRQTAMTVGLYVLGGVAAAMAAQSCKKKK